ncbi:MAG TPA: NrfD/PsrC family molybdoenzyme membrane anchor subunit [Chloroflexota bacterium]|nr:NrfD/PsrC family molybdoenzyme membrane anchor subunit [Chloroflexota bacterium]
MVTETTRTRPAEEDHPVLAANLAYDSVTDKIAGIVLAPRPTRFWFWGFAVSFSLVMLLLVAVTYLLAVGVGIWGIDIPVAWGFAIINFVWWIGIGHAGTLISAILLLVRQRWRTSINRFAEAMTIFAVANAGLFPLLHLGRPWFFYWLIPYPSTMGVWPQFRSPLIWDFFAVATYFTVSLIFWYVGMVPDLAAIRDRARGRLRQVVYGVLALGWRGSARHWRRFEDTYLLLAALATPLVVSVHSIVSFDFAVSILPGWHSTIFPPYFVAGAIYSGFAMVLTITVILRWAYHLEGYITTWHLDSMAKVMLASGLVVTYGYVMEWFIAWYGGNPYEEFTQMSRAFGQYSGWFWALFLCNVLVPQALWFSRVRTSVIGLLIVSTFINVGMWIERFVIIVTSLAQDFLPSSWGYYNPTVWDLATLAGTIGLFVCLLFLFSRFVPMIAAFEVKELVHQMHSGGNVG